MQFLSVVKLAKDDDVLCFATSLNVTQKPDFTQAVNSMDMARITNIKNCNSGFGISFKNVYLYMLKK